MNLKIMKIVLLLFLLHNSVKNSISQYNNRYLADEGAPQDNTQAETAAQPIIT